MPDDLEGQSKFQWWARLGFFARGLLYVVIGVLAMATGRTEDLTGAIRYLQGGVGGVLVVVLIAGMAGYGVWRLCDAAFGMESGRHHAKAWRHRIAAGFSGLIYSGLALKGAQLIMGGEVQEKNAQEHAADALQMPGGTIALFIAAAVLAGAGAVQLYKSWSCSFLDELREGGISETVRWLGRVGFAARGIAFLTVGWLLAQAAVTHDAGPAGGLEQALDALHGPLQFAVAAGLLIFGLFSMVEARFRSIHKPPTDHIRNKLEETASV